MRETPVAFLTAAPQRHGKGTGLRLASAGADVLLPWRAPYRRQRICCRRRRAGAAETGVGRMGKMKHSEHEATMRSYYAARAPFMPQCALCDVGALRHSESGPPDKAP
jgi:hypothetical protein